MVNSSIIAISVQMNLTNLTVLDKTIHTQNPPLDKYYPILAIELGLSIICSVTLIIMYVIVGEHRTLPGKNVITISCCLIITYVLLMVDLLMRNSIPHGICEIMGIIVQTAFLATFFWTNVMSYDIMKTMALVKTDSVRTTQYWKYSFYSWTMTLACVVSAVVLDHTDAVSEQFKPNFGLKKCWLSGQEAFLIYFNAPVGATLIANCVFFVMTARTIVKVRSATAILVANRHKKRFRLCVKLVFIMGLVWLTEFIPWITGIYYLYAIAGMLNCLHGVYLFFIFACKRRTFKQIFSTISSCYEPTTNVVNKKKSASVDTVTTVSF